MSDKCKLNSLFSEVTSLRVAAEMFRRQCLGRLAEEIGEAETWHGDKRSNGTRDVCPSGGRGKNQHVAPRRHSECNVISNGKE